MKRPINFISTMILTLTCSVDALASVVDASSDIASKAGIYHPFIDTSNPSSMPILLAGETKTTVKTKTKKKPLMMRETLQKSRLKPKPQQRHLHPMIPVITPIKALALVGTQAHLTRESSDNINPATY